MMRDANPLSVRKAVIPAAGMGTRFLPATKSMPKEMLPIVDTPVLQFVIEEAVASGIDDILIVTGRGKRAIENHFDFNPELEGFLAAAGKHQLIEQVRGIGDRARIHYIRQKEQLGLGDAIRLGRDHVGDQPFAVLLGDTIIDPPDGQRPGLRQILDVFEEKQASVVAVHHVPRHWVSRYGIVDGEPEPNNRDLVRLRQLVEKPAMDQAPSDLAIAGRYVFTPEIFDCIDATGRGVGGAVLVQPRCRQHDDHQVPVDCEHAQGAHHQPAHDGDLSRPRHRGTGQGRGDAAPSDGRHGVLHLDRG